MSPFPDNKDELSKPPLCGWETDRGVSPRELRGDLVLPGQLQAESCNRKSGSDVPAGGGKQSGEKRNATFQQSEQIFLGVLSGVGKNRLCCRETCSLSEGRERF